MALCHLDFCHHTTTPTSLSPFSCGCLIITHKLNLCSTDYIITPTPPIEPYQLSTPLLLNMHSSPITINASNHTRPQYVFGSASSSFDDEISFGTGRSSPSSESSYSFGAPLSRKNSATSGMVVLYILAFVVCLN